MEIKTYERDEGGTTNLQASWIHFWKRVRKNDGIAKFLQIFDVKLQAPFHH
jgi:IS4 transposase